MAPRKKSEIVTVPLLVRLPEPLHQVIKRLAESDRRSLNAEVIYLLERAVSSLTADSST